MPGPKPKPVKNQFPERFKTEGQRVSGDGTELVMSNGRRFKRTVLPSSAVPTPEVMDLDHEDEEVTLADPAEPND